MAKKQKMTPEELAQAEIGCTEVTPAVRWFLLLAFLCTVCSVPVIQYFQDAAEVRKDGSKGSTASLLRALSLEDKTRELERLRISQSGIGYGLELASLVNDATAEGLRKFENTLEEGSWLLKSVGPSAEQVLIGGLRSGSRDVYCGRDGWLFFRPAIECLTGRGFLEPEALKERSRTAAGQEPVQPDPVRAIVDFRNQLARRGIELVVVPSPAKATVYPERFSARYARAGAPLNNPSYPEFLRRLQAQGVRVFDPAPLLFQAKGKGEQFLKTDTHWTPAGAELVARNLADYLRTNRLIDAPLHPSPLTLHASNHIENAGDLARMLKMSDAVGYGKERVETHPVRNSDGSPWSPSRSADILLLGDSYANIYSLDGMGWGEGSGLVPQLGHYLGRPVDAIVINDKGSFSTRQQLGNELRRGQDRLAGKKVVIYEFAARELALGNWKLIDLTPGKGAGGERTLVTAAAGKEPEAVKAAAPAGLQVEGVIEDITRPPRPGSTAYKDAVIALHLKQVSSAGKPFGRPQIVVFAWGMRNDQATPASRYRRGERVSLRLRPWSEVEAKYGSYQRIELQNDEAMLLDLYWLAQPEDLKAKAAAGPVKVAAAPAAVPVVASVKGDKPGDSAATGAQAAAASGKAEPVLAAPPPASAGEQKALFQKRVAELAKSPGEARSVPGLEGWLFSRQELNHLVKGEFWGEAAQGTSMASKPDSRDPLAAILDFKEQLDRAGIELIVVPVPAKAHIYPDKLVQGVGADLPLEGADRQFLALLEKAGVECLDLTALFLEARKGGGSPVFLQNDTHWSPYGVAVVAQALKQRIAQRPWFQAAPKQQFVLKGEIIKVRGDLIEDAAAGIESVPGSRIQQVVDGQETSPLPDRNSPIVLLGDSHTLIFHSGGDMHTKDAGLPEMLAYHLRMNVDLVGVRGSGATPARVELARRKDNMAGKKLAIWCFTVREYTELQTGWRKVPVIR